MEERYIAAERHPDYESPRRLPEELVGGLAPNARYALNHPTRRGILRELHRDSTVPRTPDELLPLFPGASRSTIAYHGSILEECGGVRITAAPAERGASARSFVSVVAADPEYHRVLVATEQLDTLT
jgi:DNA-binding transcriptional ArsR family regulator